MYFFFQKNLTNLSIFKIINEADHSVLQDRIIESKHSQNYENGNQYIINKIFMLLYIINII